MGVDQSNSPSLPGLEKNKEGDESFTKYIDEKVRIIEVSKGLWNEGSSVMYGVFWTKNRIGHHRITAKSLPMVTDPNEAQRCLDNYAILKGYSKYLKPKK